MVVLYEKDGTHYVQITTRLTAEEWHSVQTGILDVTTDLMNEKLSAAGKNGLANLMQLLKDMMLDEKQTVKGLEKP